MFCHSHQANICHKKQLPGVSGFLSHAPCIQGFLWKTSTFPWITEDRGLELSWVMEIREVIPIQEERHILHLPWSLALDPEQIWPNVNIILFHVPKWFFNLIRIKTLPRENKSNRGDMVMKECLQTSGRTFFSFYF